MTLVKGLSTILGCGGHCFLHGFELQYADQCPEKELIDYLLMGYYSEQLVFDGFDSSPWTISRVSHICGFYKKSLININANATRIHSTWNVFHFLQVEEAGDHVGQKKIAGVS